MLGATVPLTTETMFGAGALLLAAASYAFSGLFTKAKLAHVPSTTLAEIGALRTQTVTYLIPVFGMAWGSLFLHEPITRGMLVGLGVILASVLLVNGAPRTSLASGSATSMT